MPEIRILTETDLRQVVHLDRDAVDCVEQGFVALAGALSAADIVVTATPASEPLIRAEWLRPGQHVTAMGSDQHHKNELEPACLMRADLYVPDRLSQIRKLGELRAAIAAGAIPADQSFAELGEIVTGKIPGRTSSDDITIADLTGTGVQDTLIATFAREQTEIAGIGTTFTS